MKKTKFYVVWEGLEPGIYTSWEACKMQIKNYPRAKYKAFTNEAAAQDAYNMGYYTFKKLLHNTPVVPDLPKGVNINSICVDAASSGNPGTMEYRGVDTSTGKQIFYQGPFLQGTNNIGEFLALVHGISFLKKNNSNRLIYSDSSTAMAWVRKKKCNSTLQKSKENKKLFELIYRAENWLQNNSFSTEILKWQTKSWGEIPADFGRKK